MSAYPSYLDRRESRDQKNMEKGCQEGRLAEWGRIQNQVESLQEKRNSAEEVIRAVRTLCSSSKDL